MSDIIGPVVHLANQIMELSLKWKVYFFTYLLINYIVEELNSAAYGIIFDTITTNTFKSLTV
jgi:hypothetical protein